MANTAMITEAPIFTTAKAKCPLFSSSNVSKLKVEKVLNPPQNPVTKNKRIQLFEIPLASIYKSIIANKILAVMLLMKVPNGKCLLNFNTPILTAYRVMLPMPPPKNMKKNCFQIIK